MYVIPNSSLANWESYGVVARDKYVVEIQYFQELGDLIEREQDLLKIPQYKGTLI